MRNFFNLIARFIASIFAIFFVITTVLAIFLTTFNRQVFNSNIYKNALVELNIYKNVPEIVGVVNYWHLQRKSLRPRSTDLQHEWRFAGIEGLPYKRPGSGCI